ncbi:L,D-transpeptidase family protein [uncultured Sphingomonas sp.]|uniref:L,D-transpeptidase family protein n=1 Tax=uncultured Sphingomonas sp. TaxID=158754 RepID=UPI0025D4DBD4|nr:L,D-transpeptidase family protein [uncultured Sphingomonas sp.]
MRKSVSHMSFGRAILAAALACGAAPCVVPAAVAAVTASTSLLPDIQTAPEGRWSRQAVKQLIGVIQGAEREGFNPADYNLATLRQAVDGASGGTGPALDILAEAAALRLANDYHFGRVTDRSSMNWMIERSPYERAQLPDRLHAAANAGSLPSFYASLLPDNPRYAALRDALAETDDPVMRDRIRVNMERWRWMPRAMGDDHIYVNVPSYKLDVVESGLVRSSYTVVVGAKATPTPLMISPANSLVVNPSWYVPASIVKSANIRAGQGGFRYKDLGNGARAIVQAPGPRNALGRIKFNLDNDQAIYLHDTPAKTAFKRDQRALSHGCIRVSNIDQLASELMSREGGDAVALEQALAGADTQTLRLPHQWPVYLVYFTVDLDANGALTSYGDPYQYDNVILAQLDGQRGGGAGTTLVALNR